MALFQRTFSYVKSLLGFSTLTQSAHSTTHGQSAGVQVNDGRAVDLCEEPNELHESPSPQIDRPRKRKALENADTSGKKRMRSGSDRSTREPPSPTDRNRDRDLMPPPSVPVSCQNLLALDRPAKTTYIENLDTFSPTRSNQSKTSDVYEEYDVDEDYNETAVAVLPPDIESWDIAEQDLYRHLTRRGREALIPQSWMIDFPTLPISLFATRPYHVPLVELHRSTEFRAIKALSDLIDTGKIVRDRAISATTELRSEVTIQRAANKYIKWALKDVGVSSKQCIPVHTVVAMKPGQKTQDTIHDLALKMHKLSARHRSECDILTSIETEEHLTMPQGHCQTSPSKSMLLSQHKLPIIYGIMICSSVLAIFTLDSHIPPPPSIAKVLTKTCHDQPQNEYPDEAVDEDPNLRYIWKFDFSDHRADVWNAFVVVITAMMIRKTLMDVYEIPTTNEEQDYEESVLDSSLMDVDLASVQNRYTARYATGHGMPRGLGIFTAQKEDDPDL